MKRDALAEPVRQSLKRYPVPFDSHYGVVSEKAPPTGAWGDYMGPIMKIDTDTLCNFSFLLPLQFHMD